MATIDHGARKSTISVGAGTVNQPRFLVPDRRCDRLEQRHHHQFECHQLNGAIAISVALVMNATTGTTTNSTVKASLT